MAIPVEGTFDYAFDIAADPRTAPTRGRGRERPGATGKRLVGLAPVLSAEDYQGEPWQLRARLTLTASDPEHALVRRASFPVDRGLVDVLRGGDVLSVSRTACGGLGLSVVRGDRLIAAAGSIVSVPLGSDVTARIPLDLIRDAERILRGRDPRYQLCDHPIELTIAGETQILHRGRPRMGPFDVLVVHGFLPGVPGTDMRVSIERCGACPDTAAHTTAQLFEEEGLQFADL